MRDAASVDSAPGSVTAESRVVPVDELSREVLDALLEGCQIVGFDYRYLYVNDVLVAQSRKSREALLGQTMMECYPGIEHTDMFKVLRRSMEERRHERLEDEFVFPDGTRICFELRFVPVQQGVCILSLDASERNATDLQQLRAELVRAKTAAEAATRDVELLGYSVAHDLRAPLRAIDGFSQALWEDYGAELDDTGKKYLGYVRDSTRRMSTLIDDLLSLCRLIAHPLKREWLDLSALAREVIARLEQAHPGRKVSVTIADGLTLYADRTLMLVVLDNLLGNAWKFTAQKPDAQIELAERQSERGRALCVRDNGAGFDMAQVDRLFGVFQRLHPPSDFPGTGIGLATVQRVIRQHGGRVWAEGKVGEGASFYFALE